MGVTAKTIKVVVVTGSRTLQDTLRNSPANPFPPPINRATGQAEYLEQAFRDWDAVLAHSFNTWGRTIEFVFVDVTGSGGRGRAAGRRVHGGGAETVRGDRPLQRVGLRR